jgi:tRNA(fMet)-specific endonuclease VapC
MDYLLDTNHWSGLQRNHPAIVDHISTLPSNITLHMPVIAQAELLAGVQLLADGKRKAELQAIYEHTVQRCASILPVTSAVADEFATILVQLRRDGHPVETNDIWIAAIAVAADLILVSNDQHFQYINGLRLEDWTESRL